MRQDILTWKEVKTWGNAKTGIKCYSLVYNLWILHVLGGSVDKLLIGCDKVLYFSSSIGGHLILSVFSDFLSVNLVGIVLVASRLFFSWVNSILIDNNVVSQMWLVHTLWCKRTFNTVLAWELLKIVRLLGMVKVFHIWNGVYNHMFILRPMLRPRVKPRLGVELVS